MPADMLGFNRALIEEFRANGGRLSGPMAGRSLVLLTTTGARTGEPRTAVLGYGRDGDDYVVIASANGAASHPAWYHNLVANPIATLEIGDQKLQVRAETAGPEERERRGAVIPWLDSQQRLTSREIPVVVLHPIG